MTAGKGKQPSQASVPVEQSAGRAAGYCYVPHPSEPLHCTRWPNHKAQGFRHKHYYADVEW
ncbi:hypothetical protein ACGFYM_20635 [Streptomyces sp. NPDC048231]|uniref:hypothetical protein n=1 Tax=Streptomyces sp. NPDC048231 TaxID=3365519 RepID=UPI003714A72E